MKYDINKLFYRCIKTSFVQLRNLWFVFLFEQTSLETPLDFIRSRGLKSVPPRNSHAHSALGCRDHWKRPKGRPSSTWKSTVKKDLTPLNIGYDTALKEGGKQRVLGTACSCGYAPFVEVCHEEEEDFVKQFRRTRHHDRPYILVLLNTIYGSTAEHHIW